MRSWLVGLVFCGLRTLRSLVNYPCHGKYSLVNVAMFCSILSASTYHFGLSENRIIIREGNCLRKNSETFGILEIALFNKISLSWQDKRMKVFFF